MNDVEKIIESFGCKLYDIEIERAAKPIYRILVYKKEGVSLDMLTDITKAISPLLDVKAPIGGEYLLEVSSPGLERKIKAREHYEYAIGEIIRFQLGSKRIKGKLLGISGNEIDIETKSGVEKFTISEIINAKVVFEWNKSEA